MLRIRVLFDSPAAQLCALGGTQTCEAGTKGRLRWFAVLWAAGVYLVLVQTLPAAVNHLMLAGPLLAALLTLFPWPDKMGRGADLVGMVFTAVFVVLGSASIGLLFLPTPAALFLSAESAGRHSRLSSRVDR